MRLVYAILHPAGATNEQAARRGDFVDTQKTAMQTS